MAQNPYLVSYSLTQPTGSVRTATLYVVVNQGDSAGPITIDIPGVTPGIVSMADGGAPGAGNYSYLQKNIPAGATYSFVIYDASPAKLPGFSQAFTVDPAPPTVLGCTSPNAFNYDADATEDSDPTSCVFVVVDVAPAQLVAAHLPIPVEMRAAPTMAGEASIVILILETAPSLAGPWQEFGRLGSVCNDESRVSFNLSEAAKSLLRLLPPVESGIDPALSALLRVRYEVQDPEGLAVLYEGEVGTCRVLNAVVQASNGATLTSPTPYETKPDNGQLWQSTATYAAGVRAAPLARPADGCRARQFVWLNAAGAWDQGFFFGRHVHTTAQSDAIAYRDLAGADRYASKGVVRDTLQVYSDVTDWPTYQLLRGIRQSIQAYERLAPNSYVPVLLSAESFPEYTEQTDKTFQVNFTVSYPAQQIQTQ